jgi:hypothetical protein
MPFHLEKGPLGLRMDYMAKIPAVKAAALAQLSPPNNADPFNIAVSLTVGPVTISLFDDDRYAFAGKLDQLSATLNLAQSPNKTFGDEYLEEQALLRPLNQDSTGNRTAFKKFWLNAIKKNSPLVGAIRSALVDALKAGSELDVWWECTLPDNTGPDVAVSTDLQEVARLMFRTDHSTIAPQTSTQQPRTPDP